MANHKDADKRNRQNIKRRARNRHYRTKMRSHIKQLHATVESGDHALAMEHLRSTVGVIHRLVGKGIIHRNQAARRISRLNKAVKALQA